MKCQLWRLFILIPVSYVSIYPLLNCTAVTEYCVLGLRPLPFALSEQEVFLFLDIFFNISLLWKKSVSFRHLLEDDLVGKLHFWGGANTVCPIFVIVYLLAPVISLNGSSHCGGTVRVVWAQAGHPAPAFYLQEVRDELKGRLQNWRMCFGQTWVTHFKLSTWKQYIVHLASWQVIKIKSGILLLVIQCFFFYSAVSIKVFRIC